MNLINQLGEAKYRYKLKLRYNYKNYYVILTKSAIDYAEIKINVIRKEYIYLHVFTLKNKIKY